MKVIDECCLRRDRKASESTALRAGTCCLKSAYTSARQNDVSLRDELSPIGSGYCSSLLHLIRNSLSGTSFAFDIRGWLYDSTEYIQPYPVRSSHKSNPSPARVYSNLPPRKDIISFRESSASPRWTACWRRLNAQVIQYRNHKETQAFYLHLEAARLSLIGRNRACRA